MRCLSRHFNGHHSIECESHDTDGVLGARIVRRTTKPGVVRELQNSVSLEDGTISDTYLRCYLDFEAEIPDELCEVHKWGPIK